MNDCMHDAWAWAIAGRVYRALCGIRHRWRSVRACVRVMPITDKRCPFCGGPAIALITQDLYVCVESGQRITGLELLTLGIHRNELRA